MTDTDRLAVRTVSETDDKPLRRRITTTSDGTHTWWEIAGPLGAVVVTVRPETGRPVRTAVHRRAALQPGDTVCDFLLHHDLRRDGCTQTPAAVTHLNPSPGGWDRQTAVSGLQPWWTLRELYVTHLVAEGI